MIINLKKIKSFSVIVILCSVLFRTNVLQSLFKRENIKHIKNNFESNYYSRYLLLRGKYINKFNKYNLLIKLF